MSFQVQSVTVGGPRLFLVAGPCVIESEEHALKMAEAISAIARELEIPFIFKASYDKANRTSGASFRGPGLMEGLRILNKVAECVRVPILTDVHEPGHAAPVGGVADVIQIPAFLCRQTDLLVAAGRTGRAVNIKKGQFVSPWDMRHAVAKVRETGNDRVFLTERGTSFGYNNLVVDMRSLALTLPTRCSSLRRAIQAPRPRAISREYSRADSRSSSRCFRAPRWPRAWTASSLRYTTIHARRSPTGLTRWNWRGCVPCSNNCCVCTTPLTLKIYDF